MEQSVVGGDLLSEPGCGLGGSFVGLCQRVTFCDSFLSDGVGISELLSVGCVGPVPSAEERSGLGHEEAPGRSGDTWEERKLGPGGGGGGGGGAEQGLQIMSRVVGWEEAWCRQQHAAGRGDQGLQGHLDSKSCELGMGKRTNVADRSPGLMGSRGF